MSVTLHTSLGDLKLELFCDEVPRTAENFLALCASGYYDGTKFHRRGKRRLEARRRPPHPPQKHQVVHGPGWRPHWHRQGRHEYLGREVPGRAARVAQGSSPSLACSLAAPERRSSQHSARGVVSMANSGPNTNGSQFFISYSKQAQLNGAHPAGGRARRQADSSLTRVPLSQASTLCLGGSFMGSRCWTSLRRRPRMQTTSRSRTLC